MEEDGSMTTKYITGKWNIEVNSTYWFIRNYDADDWIQREGMVTVAETEEGELSFTRGMGSRTCYVDVPTEVVAEALRQMGYEVTKKVTTP
jgi:hypothetical protein